MTTAQVPEAPLKSHAGCLCDDALFVVASLQRFDLDLLGEVAKRRAEHYQAARLGEAPRDSPWDDHVVAMSATLAALAPPPWLPMYEVIESVTLQTGARGVRSLFTSKPSEKQVLRTRALALTALRYMSAVMAAGAPLDDEEKLLRRCVAEGFGLEPANSAAMIAEEPMPLEPVDPAAGLDNKLARAMACGMWQAGMRDGLDPSEEATIVQACVRLGLGPEGTEAARKEAKGRLDSRGAFAVASVDAIRHVLADDAESSARNAMAAARLGLPPVYRADTVAVIEHGAPVALAHRHSLDGAGRQACLAMAWFAALGTDPTVSRLGELTLRHDRIDADLKAKGDAATVRAQVFAFVQEQLAKAAQALGM